MPGDRRSIGRLATLTRYAACFERHAAAKEAAFVPFAVLGDPDPETSLAVLEAFVAGGADMLELGIPFSDPIEGPAIQGADRRALRVGATPPVALEIPSHFRVRHADTPIGIQSGRATGPSPTPGR